MKIRAAKVFFFSIGFLLVLLLFLAGLIFTTVDLTAYEKMPYYRKWKSTISTYKPAKIKQGEWSVGWARVNITPSQAMPTAGYGNRRGKAYESVKDSIFVRALVLGNGNQKLAIVTADLLLIPPEVSKRLRELLPADGISFKNVYFGATHSHNSIGGWGKRLAGAFFSGKYNEAVVENIARSILQAIKSAARSQVSSQLSYLEAVDSTDVRNRLVGDSGQEDSLIRSIKIRRVDGKSAVLTTYSAHATLLGSSNLVLSRDWPGTLVDSLEKSGFDFAMYMSGAVGSMGPVERGADDFEEIKNETHGILRAFANSTEMLDKAANLQSLSLPLPLRAPTPRVNLTLALRTWVFNTAFGKYPTEIKAALLGNVLLVGMPCDFSGELVAPLDEYARKKGLKLIITSFNGGYIGYVTADSRFYERRYETVDMNWYGPYNGSYLQEVTRDIIDKFALNPDG